VNCEITQLWRKQHCLKVSIPIHIQNMLTIEVSQDLSSVIAPCLLGNATGFPVNRKPGKTAGFQNRKTGFVRNQENGFGGFNFGCQNCTEKRAGILEVKLIAFAFCNPNSIFKVNLVKVHLGLVQTNIFGVILCNLHNVICSYCFLFKPVYYLTDRPSLS